MTIHVFTNEELRAIALGKTQFRKCPACDNDGQEYWCGNTGMGAGPAPPAGVAKEDVESGDCEHCQGVGFYMIYGD